MPIRWGTGRGQTHVSSGFDGRTVLEGKACKLPVRHCRSDACGVWFGRAWPDSTSASAGGRRSVNRSEPAPPVGTDAQRIYERKILVGGRCFTAKVHRDRSVGNYRFSREPAPVRLGCARCVSIHAKRVRTVWPILAHPKVIALGGNDKSMCANVNDLGGRVLFVCERSLHQHAGRMVLSARGADFGNKYDVPVSCWREMLLSVAQTEKGQEEVRDSPSPGTPAKRTGTDRGASARGASARGPLPVEFCGRSECGWLRNDRESDCRAIKGIGKLGQSGVSNQLRLVHGEPEDEAA